MEDMGCASHFSLEEKPASALMHQAQALHTRKARRQTRNQKNVFARLLQT